MRRPLALMSAIALLALAGCEKRTENPAPSAGNTLAGTAPGGISGALDAARTSASDAVTKLRDQAVTTMEPRLESAKAELAKLREKAAALPEAVRPTVESAMAEVDRQVGVAGEQLAKLKTATSESWQTISAELGTTLDKLGTAVKDLAAKFPS